LKNTLRYRGWQNISAVRSKQVWGRGRGNLAGYTLYSTLYSRGSQRDVIYLG
jgi:hypothetical protein